MEFTATGDITTFLDILPLLVEKGAQLNRQDKYGHAPLHRAASRGYEKIVEGLLRAGALADPRDNEGNTPLHMACEEDRLNTGQFIKTFTRIIRLYFC